MIAKLICCGEDCGKFIRSTDTVDGKTSHGLCPDCTEIEYRKIDEYVARSEGSPKGQAQSELVSTPTVSQEVQCSY